MPFLEPVKKVDGNIYLVYGSNKPDYGCELRCDVEKGASSRIKRAQLHKPSPSTLPTKKVIGYYYSLKVI